MQAAPNLYRPENGGAQQNISQYRQNQSLRTMCSCVQLQKKVITEA